MLIFKFNRRFLQFGSEHYPAWGSNYLDKTCESKLSDFLCRHGAESWKLRSDIQDEISLPLSRRKILDIHGPMHGAHSETRPRNSDKRVIWTFLISISLCLLSYVSLPTTNTSAEERGCVCVCLCVFGSFRKISSSSKHSAVCLLAVQCKTFCWAYYFRHWVGSTFSNWQIRNIVNYFNLKSI